MTKIEALELELAARKMVDGTGLNWSSVMRHKYIKQTPHALTHCDLSDIELALGIIEGKPVWEGDRVFDELRVEYRANKHMDFTKFKWYWNPPRPKTIMVELPLEVVKNFANYYHGATEILAEACRKALEELK